MHHRRRALFASIGTATACLIIRKFPSVELEVFARGTACIASLFTGAPALETEHGWLLPLAHQPVLVSTACSGTSFFIITCALLCWHSAPRIRTAALVLPLAVVAALAVTLCINSLRIICLLQAHRWLIPLLPASYSAFAHMLVGVAVFLPALIALNTLPEFYGYFKDHYRARSA